MSDKIARIGILTVSDRASRGEYEDRSGPAVQAYLNELLITPWEAIRRIVPDEQDQIEVALITLAGHERCDLIITSGGTGPAARDITPEATEAVCEKMLPGFGEAMREASLKAVPTAILSRQTAGIRGNTLIINLPGSPKAVRECLDAVFAAVPACLDLIDAAYIDTDPAKIAAFRPKHN